MCSFSYKVVKKAEIIPDRVVFIERETNYIFYSITGSIGSLRDFCDAKLSLRFK